MKDDIAPPASPGRRAASYWFLDGLPYVVFGLALIISGALEILWRTYLPYPRLGHYVTMAIVFVLYFSLWRPIVDAWKSRVTYPRTGYVQPPEETEPQILTALWLRPPSPPKENVTSFERRVATAVYFFLFTPLSASPGPNWVIPVLLVALAATLYVLNRKSEPSFRVGSVLALALMGLPFVWIDVPPLLQPSLPFLLVGFWLAVLGGSALVKYLGENRNPKIQEGERA